MTHSYARIPAPFISDSLSGFFDFFLSERNIMRILDVERIVDDICLHSLDSYLYAADLNLHLPLVRFQKVSYPLISTTMDPPSVRSKITEIEGDLFHAPDGAALIRERSP